MNYEQSLNYLFSQLPIYQRQGKIAYKPDIGNITKLSKALGNPHRKFKSIHIAGTNGKGSTSHLVAAVLQAAGLKVGLYTSPHLKDFRERVKINGKMISKNAVTEFINDHYGRFQKYQAQFF